MRVIIPTYGYEPESLTGMSQRRTAAVVTEMRAQAILTAATTGTGACTTLRRCVRPHIRMNPTNRAVTSSARPPSHQRYLSKRKGQASRSGFHVGNRKGGPRVFHGLLDAPSAEEEGENLEGNAEVGDPDDDVRRLHRAHEAHGSRAVGAGMAPSRGMARLLRAPVTSMQGQSTWERESGRPREGASQSEPGHDSDAVPSRRL
jgi:hypothetical protein